MIVASAVSEGVEVTPAPSIIVIEDRSHLGEDSAPVSKLVTVVTNHADWQTTTVIPLVH